jgi:hypothetical protein
VLRDLGRRVKHDFDEREPYWLHAAVQSLCKDGLARVSSGSSAAIAPEMVAEERAPYDAGIEEPQGLTLEHQVSLP